MFAFDVLCSCMVTVLARAERKPAGMGPWDMRPTCGGQPVPLTSSSRREPRAWREDAGRTELDLRLALHLPQLWTVAMGTSARLPQAPGKKEERDSAGMFQGGCFCSRCALLSRCFYHASV